MNAPARDAIVADFVRRLVELDPLAPEVREIYDQARDAGVIPEIRAALSGASEIAMRGQRTA